MGLFYCRCCHLFDPLSVSINSKKILQNEIFEINLNPKKHPSNPTFERKKIEFKTSDRGSALQSSAIQRGKERLHRLWPYSTAAKQSFGSFLPSRHTGRERQKEMRVVLKRSGDSFRERREREKWAAIIGELTGLGVIDRCEDDQERRRRARVDWAAFVGVIERRDDDQESSCKLGRDRERDESRRVLIRFGKGGRSGKGGSEK